MKLAPVTEKLGLPTNLGRKFGEKYLKDFITPGKFANLFTAFEKTYPELKPVLTKTFEKSNDLLKYIKPEKGDESYRVPSLPEAVAQELLLYLDNIIAATDELSNLDDVPNKQTTTDAIQYFHDLFEDMLNIFTTNTIQDEPLKPYKQTKMGFREEKIRKTIRKEIKKLNEAALCGDKKGKPCPGGDGTGTWQDSHVTNSCLCVQENGGVIHNVVSPSDDGPIITKNIEKTVKDFLGKHKRSNMKFR